MLKQKTVWVNKDTAQEYNKPINPEEWINPVYNENGEIIEGSLFFLNESSAFSIITLTAKYVPSEAPQNSAEKVWVLKGTGVILDSKIDENDIVNPIVAPETNELVQISLPVYKYHPLAKKNLNKSNFQAEFITRQLQAEREDRVWVYIHTAKTYKKRNNNEQLSQVIFDEAGRPINYAIAFKGYLFSIESITRVEKKRREKMVWVRCDTREPIPLTINLMPAQVVQRNHLGEPERLRLFKNKQWLDLEFTPIKEQLQCQENVLFRTTELDPFVMEKKTSLPTAHEGQWVYANGITAIENLDWPHVKEVFLDPVDKTIHGSLIKNGYEYYLNWIPTKQELSENNERRKDHPSQYQMKITNSPKEISLLSKRPETFFDVEPLPEELLNNIKNQIHPHKKQKTTSEETKESNNPHSFFKDFENSEIQLDSTNSNVNQL